MLTATVAAGCIASAQILDFEDITTDEGGNPIDSGGFRFNFTADGWGIFTDSFSNFVINRNGTTRLVASGEQGGFTARVLFKPLDDSAFTVSSMDMATLWPGFATGQVEVIGNFEGGGSVTTTIDTTNSFVNYGLSAAYTDLDNMVVRSTFTGNFLQDRGFEIDNINLNPIPEPASMIALGLGAVALMRRRRKTA